MEALIARLTADDDPQTCQIQECSKEATFHVMKMKDDDSEEERFFCEEHGQEYALRGHLVISDAI